MKDKAQLRYFLDNVASYTGAWIEIKEEERKCQNKEQELTSDDETEYKKEKKQAERYIKNPEMAFFCNQVQNLLAVYRNGTLTTDMYNDCIKRLISGFTKEHCFLFGNILKHGEAVDAEEFFMTILENDPHGTGVGEYKVALSDYYDKFERDHYRDVTLLITQEDLQKYKGQELTSDDETDF